jgi:hypothetical protein
MKKLQTPVWQLVGLLSNCPGLLTLGDDSLSFETAAGTKFRCEMSQIRDVKWPWYQFNCYMTLSAEGTKYRFSFARPNGAAAAWSPVGAATNLFALGGASKTGKAWRTELAGRTVASAA